MFNITENLFSLGIFLGLMTQPIFNILGIYTGDLAVSYYAEVHQSKLNSFIHTIGMPFTYYGLLLCVPPLFVRDREKIVNLQCFFYPYFISYYLSMDLLTGVIVAICYFPSQELAMEHMMNSKSILKTSLYGFSVATIALTIQEVFGHWLCGDPPSRIEAIPNAIWHAGYYSIWHLIRG